MTNYLSTILDPDSLVSVAARAASDKHGERTVVLQVGEVLAITESFVITSASNTRLVKTIADEVEAKVKAASGRSPLRVEGLSDLSWVLIDFGDFVVHVFLEQTREFYDLERLWSDAPRVGFDAGPAAAASGG